MDEGSVCEFVSRKVVEKIYDNENDHQLPIALQNAYCNCNVLSRHSSFSLFRLNYYLPSSESCSHPLYL